MYMPSHTQTHLYYSSFDEISSPNTEFLILITTDFAFFLTILGFSVMQVQKIDAATQGMNALCSTTCKLSSYTLHFVM